MSQKLDMPVLKVDVASIHQVDPRNTESLYSMWTVFSHCASALEEGKRLENLSWRIWNRETLCCGSEDELAISRTSSFHSMDSAPSNKKFKRSSAVRSEEIHAKSSSTNSLSIDQRNLLSKHTTSDDLEKMVIIITENKKLQELPDLRLSHTCNVSRIETGSRPVVLPSSPAIPIKANATNTVRGSTPSSSTYIQRFEKSISSDLTDDIASVVLFDDSQSKAKTIFALGGSSGDESCNHEGSSQNSSWARLSQAQQKKKNAMFSFGGSSNEEEAQLIEKVTDVSRNGSVLGKVSSWRETTFQEEIARRTIREEVIVDDVFETDEEDEVDESAIEDDDDSSEWEDSVEGSGNVSVDEKNLFRRVDSRPNLTSRRSLITTMLHQHDRMEALLSAATNSKSTPEINTNNFNTSREKSTSLAQESTEHVSNLGPILETPRSEARPIPRQGMSSQKLALSPRTTRRNMLASELTVSLRQHLLWERKQKSQTVNAVLKRRHTAQDIAQLRQLPEKSFMGKEDIKGCWENYFEGGLGEYNSRGW
ncbi:putative duf1752-domain-containing protein [Golovinomyces cichoracearum]|uniref:Putative duf1752-domain-containing protein n=1 Tax=Golovinomyces cichoracearum TaxID=62708 RepID=A0A420JAP3_9PEZI|nr:putative duf1752-domain-containing protein [Golovinomyces cichoracearum]